MNNLSHNALVRAQRYLNNGNLVDPLGVADSWNENNPYKTQNPYGTLSAWNNFTDLLGFTNHSGQAYSTWLNNAQQWESQYALSMEQRDYESAPNQVDLSRRAGQNPDLLGVESGMGDVPGSMAERGNGQPYSPQSDFASVISGLGSVVSAAFGIFNGLSSMANARLALDVDNFEKLSGGILDDAAGAVASRFTDSTATGDELMSLVDKYLQSARVYEDGSRIENDNADFLSQVELPPAMSRRGEKWQRNRLYSMMTSSDFAKRVYDKISENRASAKSMLESTASLKALDSVAGESGQTVEDVLVDFSSVAFKYSAKLNKSLYERYNYEQHYYNSLDPYAASRQANAEAGYSAEYMSALDADVVAGSENEIAGYNRQQAYMNRMYNKMFEDMNETLGKAAKGNSAGARFAKILLFRLNFYRATVMGIPKMLNGVNPMVLMK